MPSGTGVVEFEGVSKCLLHLHAQGTGSATECGYGFPGCPETRRARQGGHGLVAAASTAVTRGRRTPGHGGWRPVTPRKDRWAELPPASEEGLATPLRGGPQSDLQDPFIPLLFSSKSQVPQNKRNEGSYLKSPPAP